MTGALLKVVAQLVLLLMLAPLVSGFIKTLKARLQMRRGPRLLTAIANTATSRQAVLPVAVGRSRASGQSPEHTCFASRSCHGNGPSPCNS